MGFRKGQVGMEAIISVGIVIFLFLGLFLVYFYKSAEISNLEQELDERAECMELANVITNVFALGDGVEITVKISENMTVEPGKQRIYSENSFCTFPVKRVFQNSSLVFDSFILQSGNVSIINEEGAVIVNNA